MHFSNSGDSGTCVPKARLEKAKHRGCLLVLISFSYLFVKMCLLTLTHGGAAPPGPASLCMCTLCYICICGNLPGLNWGCSLQEGFASVSTKRCCLGTSPALEPLSRLLEW